MSPAREQPADDAHERLTLDGTLPTPTPSGAPPPEGEALPQLAGWDRYVLEGFIGQGGMGRVYRAHDPRLKRTVALKFIRGDDPELTRRFLQEAQAQARVEHPNVCRVYEVGEVQGRLYIAMAFLEGLPLAEAARGTSPEHKARLALQVAEGLHAAHRLGLVHRDVKPQNVLVERSADGAVCPYVVDFGLARQSQDQSLTATGTLLGTPWYMAPEQALGQRHVDRRADVYSLGATLFELLCGRPPFVGAGPMEVLSQVLHDEPPRPRALAPEVPRDLDTIVLKCLEKDPARRYDSCRALADDLQRFLDGEPISARAAGLGERLVRRARRNPALAASLAALALALLGWGAWMLWSTVDQRRRLAVAQELGQEAKAIEVLMRFASHMQPLHDVRRERALVRQRLQTVAAKVERLGSVARGPGEYALGRGQLALDEHALASAHLRRAWEGGYRTPDVAYALGLAEVGLYQKGLTELRSAGSREEYEQRQAELAHGHLEPALAYLAQAGGVSIDAPEYVQALVAFLRDDFDRALEQGAAALERAPWFYEARVLRAQAYTKRAGQDRDAGRTESALRDFGLAEAEFRAAIESARSYPPAYAGLCGLFSGLADLDMQRGGSLERRLAPALEVCGQALQADPDQPSTLLDVSDMQWQLAAELDARGQDPRPALREAIAAAERTLPSAVNLALAWDNLGIAYSLYGEYERRHERAAEPWFERAAGHLAACMERFPRFVSCFCNAASIEKLRAEAALAAGLDVAPHVEAARVLIARGRLIRPNFCLPLELAVVEELLVRQLVQRGADPSQAIASCEGALSEARAANPAHFELDILETRLALAEATWNQRRRMPADAALERARRALERLGASAAGDTRLSELRRMLATARAAAQPATR